MQQKMSSKCDELLPATVKFLKGKVKTCVYICIIFTQPSLWFNGQSEYWISRHLFLRGKVILGLCPNATIKCLQGQVITSVYISYIYTYLHIYMTSIIISSIFRSCALVGCRAQFSVNLNPACLYPDVFDNSTYLMQYSKILISSAKSIFLYYFT